MCVMAAFICMCVFACVCLYVAFDSVCFMLHSGHHAEENEK